MSEQTGYEATDTQGSVSDFGDNTGSEQNTGGGEAPWAGYLNDLPESVRPLVEPKFREWDASVTQRFQQVHSQYEPYRAWEPIASEYDPDTAMQAIQLLEAINTDPERVYNALAEAYGLGGEQGDAEPDGDEDDEDYDPRLGTLEEMTNAMADILLSQQEQERIQAEDAELDQYLDGLRQQYGEYDEDYVLAHMQMGMSGEQAIEKYHSMLNAVAQQAYTQQPPAILGSGGGVPIESIDPAQLSSKDTKDLIAQFLAQANREG